MYLTYYTLFSWAKNRFWIKSNQIKSSNVSTNGIKEMQANPFDGGLRDEHNGRPSGFVGISITTAMQGDCTNGTI